MLRSRLHLLSALSCKAAIVILWASLFDPAVAQTTASSVDTYTSPQRMAPLPDGRRINLVCSGHGTPTVILTAGLGDWSIAWRQVQPTVAERTRVCSWDRAGFGFSDPRKDDLDIARSAHDLGLALQAERIDGPFILVGHSMGGLEALLFAQTHRRDTAGLILVDPAIPGQYQLFARVAPHFTAFARKGRSDGAKAAAACARYLRNPGTGAASPDACPPPVLPFYPREVIAALTPLQADPDRVLTQSSFVATMERSTKLGLGGQRSIGETPLMVLSAPADDMTVPAGVPTAFSFPPDVDPQVLEEVPKMAAILAEGHIQLSKLSNRGSVRKVLGVGHYIPLFRPDLVIEAINELITEF